MGTYVIQTALTVDENTGGDILGGGFACTATDVARLNGINSANVAIACENTRACNPFAPSLSAQTFRLGHNLSSNIISLDGAAKISFNNLPAGFLISTETVKFHFTNPGTSFSSGSLFLQFDALTESPAILMGFGGAAGIKSFDHPFPLSVLGLFTDGFGFRISGAPTLPAENWFYQIYDGSLSGNFTLLTTSISILPNPAVEDDIISITGDGNLTDITRIKGKDNDDNVIVDVDSADFIQWTLTLIRFRFHAPGYSGPLILEGTTFSGSVFLGSIEILLVDGSGIYRIIANKRNDTIYEASSAPSPVTVDVAIPTPFAKTGFIGS